MLVRAQTLPWIAAPHSIGMGAVQVQTLSPGVALLPLSPDQVAAGAYVDQASGAIVMPTSGGDTQILLPAPVQQQPDAPAVPGAQSDGWDNVQPDGTATSAGMCFLPTVPFIGRKVNGVCAPSISIPSPWNVIITAGLAVLVGSALFSRRRR